MGCDIHCYIEYKKKHHEGWSDFGGRINPGRNYWMFGMMAGVRLNVTPVVAPRGLPEDVSYSSGSDSRIYISEVESEGCCNAENAARWVADGSSTYVSNHEGKPTWVTHPDWHSHSWLNANELELAIASYLVKSGFSVNLLA